MLLLLLKYCIMERTDYIEVDAFVCFVAEMFISQYLRGGAMPPVPDWKHYTVGWVDRCTGKSPVLQES